MSIFITGAAGFIGQKICEGFLNKGHHVLGLDIVPRSNVLSTLLNHPKFSYVIADLRKKEELKPICRMLFEVGSPVSISCVIHLAASIKVGESEENPYLYYENNVFSTLNVLEMMKTYKLKNLIFASTAAVYGTIVDVGDNGVTEDLAGNAESVYGSSKYVCEEMISHYSRTQGINAVMFRFFNVSGAPEDHNPVHLIPIILKSIQTQNPFTIFGSDYPTRDGTCIRDYIHLADLVSAHLLAFRWFNTLSHSNQSNSNVKENQTNKGNTLTLNLGTSSGFTVQEVLDACIRCNGKSTTIIDGERRSGDPAFLIANSDLAKEKLGWSPQKTLDDMINDSIV